MRFSVPHPIPYQGSKRRLADAILSYVPDSSHRRLIEPFAGSAAVTLSAAYHGKFAAFVIGDKLKPLVELWQMIIDKPSEVAATYEQLWLLEREATLDRYYKTRSEFNTDRDPVKLLYLLARCVKNAVRFNPSGEFNQSPDKRRAGTKPATMSIEIHAAHSILTGRSTVVCADFMELIESAQAGDLIYLDPPYQGTTEGRDRRYIEGVSREKILTAISELNRKGISFVLSYDGSLGDRSYGERLPLELASRVLLNVGRSSQATLNGRDEDTVESLYISHNLDQIVENRTPRTLQDFNRQSVISFA